MDPSSPRRRTLARRDRRLLRRVVPVLLLSALCLGVAWLTPLITLTSLFGLVTSDVSIAGVAGDLWRSGEYLLFVVFSASAIALPVAKLVLVTWVAAVEPVGTRRMRRLVRLLERLGGWSLVDVLVVAMVIVIVKQSGFAAAASSAAVYAFVAFIALSGFAAHLVLRSGLGRARG